MTQKQFVAAFDLICNGITKSEQIKQFTGKSVEVELESSSGTSNFYLFCEYTKYFVRFVNTPSIEKVLEEGVPVDGEGTSIGKRLDAKQEISKELYCQIHNRLYLIYTRASIQENELTVKLAE